MFSFVVLVSLLATLHCATGDLELLLSGYSDIPTDGSAVVAIPDIGTHSEGTALICRHGITGIPPSSGIDKWFFVHENGAEEEVVSSGDTGFTVSRGQSDGAVRLERTAGSSPLEGTYKCSVETSPSEIETVSVYLYWPLAELEVAIEVLSQSVEDKRFSVMCWSEGGRIVSSSLTGPGGEALGELQPVEGQQEGRGGDNYSLTVVMIAGENGDVFTCTAATEGSTYMAQNVLSVAGRVENVVVTQIPSFSPTLNVSWSPATEGAPVTGYTVHYTSSGVGGGNEHNGSVFTIGNESSAVIDNLLADGRAYSVVVEAHSLHFSSFSQPTSYTPCVVSHLSVASRTHSTLSLMWGRPQYITGNLRGVLEYVTLDSDEGSESRWLFIEGSSEILPVLEGLEEFSNYSIRMAVLDESDRLCVFNEPLVALTGLGPAGDLKVHREVDGIQLSWSPPLTPSSVVVDYTVAYTAISNGAQRTTTTTTTSLTWRIRAEQGDMYTVTVTTTAESGPGETTEITIGIDYQRFQIRIDEIERCGDLLEGDPVSMATSVSAEIGQVLGHRCSCEVQITEAVLDCQSDDQDFVIFSGILFAPISTASDQLLSLLEDWVSGGPDITIAHLNSVNPNCALTDSVSGCFTLSSNQTASQPTTSDSPSSTQQVATKTSEEGLSVSLLAGVAAGCFILGILSALVAVLMYYIFKRQQIRKRGITLQRRAHGLLNSNDCEGNPRYVSAEYGGETKPQQRELPLIPLVGAGVTFTNPAIKAGATREINIESNEAYETLSTTPGKVQNPMYDVVDDVKARREKRLQLTASDYQDVGLVKAPVTPQDEYITMLPSPTKK